MYSETQHNQHSTGKLIYKYILFRNFIKSMWAPCAKVEVNSGQLFTEVEVNMVDQDIHQATNVVRWKYWAFH